MKISKKILSFCILGCWFSLNAVAAQPGRNVSRPAAGPPPLPALPRPAGQETRPMGQWTPIQQAPQDFDVRPEASMPGGLMRRPTEKSHAAAAAAQRAKSDRTRVTSRDVFRAWDAPGTPGIVSAEYFHPYGSVVQYSDPYTGAVLGHEFITLDGRRFPYNLETGEIAFLEDPTLFTGRTLEDEDRWLGTPQYEMDPFRSATYGRELTMTPGEGFEEEQRTLELFNGSKLNYDPRTGLVEGSREIFGPNGNMESTLYEHDRQITPNGIEYLRRRNLTTGEERTFADGVELFNDQSAMQLMF